jgi:hypothetical protein
MVESQTLVSMNSFELRNSKFPIPNCQFPSSKVEARRSRLEGRSLAGLILLVLTSGCVTTGSFLVSAKEKAPEGEPCQVAAAWIPEVIRTPDSVNGGQPMPGFAGRVYLFSEEVKYPLVNDGTIVVTLYDRTKGSGKNEIPLEEWRLDRDSLKRLERKDAIGWGYTVFLPWRTYRPDITHVELRLRYHKAKGGLPLYAGSQPFSIREGNSQVTVRTEKRSVASPAPGPPPTGSIAK